LYIDRRLLVDERNRLWSKLKLDKYILNLSRDVDLNISKHAEYLVNHEKLFIAIPHDESKICFNGIGNMPNLKFDVIVANHSLYDITPNELSELMYQTGAKICYATMNLPKELEFVDEFDNRDLDYVFKTRQVATYSKPFASFFAC